MNKDEIYKFLIENDNEAIKLYKEYLHEWIDNNFMYFQANPLYMHIPIAPDRSSDPFYILSKYIKELKLHNKTYSNQKEKNAFFVAVSEKVLNDIRNILLKYDENIINKILSYCYSISSYNRDLSFKLLRFQQSKKYTNDEDQILNLLCTIMVENPICNTDIEEYTTEIEQFIATEDDAIELLIKIIQSEDYCTKDSMDFTYIILKELLTLSHVLVLAIHTRQDLTKGINKMAIIEVDSEGIINAPNAFPSNNIDVSNYNYRFNMDWSEYNDQLIHELDNEVFYKYGFYFHDVTILSNMFKFNNNIMVAGKNEYLKMMTNIGIENKRAENLFYYFSFNGHKEKILAENLYKYLINYDMISQKIFINYDDTHFICYKFFVKYASEYFRASVFNSPHKFFAHDDVANKITDSFCKTVETILKNAFPESVTITNFYCSSDREIDVVFILHNKIYLIECKRLSFAETNNNMHNIHKSLIKDYINQLDKEVEAFEKNMDKILNDFIQNKLINIMKKYELKGLLVTKEFSTAHIPEAKYPILMKNQLIKYINNDIKKI